MLFLCWERGAGDNLSMKDFIFDMHVVWNNQ